MKVLDFLRLRKGKEEEVKAVPVVKVDTSLYEKPRRVIELLFGPELADSILDEIIKSGKDRYSYLTMEKGVKEERLVQVYSEVYGLQYVLFLEGDDYFVDKDGYLVDRRTGFKYHYLPMDKDVILVPKSPISKKARSGNRIIRTSILSSHISQLVAGFYLSKSKYGYYYTKTYCRFHSRKGYDKEGKNLTVYQSQVAIRTNKGNINRVQGKLRAHEYGHQVSSDDHSKNTKPKQKNRQNQVRLKRYYLHRFYPPSFL